MVCSQSLAGQFPGPGRSEGSHIPRGCPCSALLPCTSLLTFQSSCKPKAPNFLSEPSLLKGGDVSCVETRKAQEALPALTAHTPQQPSAQARLGACSCVSFPTHLGARGHGSQHGGAQQRGEAGADLHHLSVNSGPALTGC